MPKLSGTLKHSSLMAGIIDRARARQHSLVITLLDLKNPFSEVHYNLISEVLRYHHVPIPIQTLIDNFYTDFKTAVLTSEYHLSSLLVGRGVCQVIASVLFFSNFVLLHSFSILRLGNFVSLGILIMIRDFYLGQYTSFNLLMMLQ